MFKKSLVLLMVVFALLVPSVVDAQGPIPPGSIAVPWTLAAPDDVELMTQVTHAAYCLRYVTGVDTVFKTLPTGRREIVVFIYIEADRDVSQFISHMLWYEWFLYPDDFGVYANQTPPSAYDRVCR